MLERESCEGRWQVSLRPQGLMRFLVAPFLVVWLCGWAVGEAFAAGTLLAGLRDVLGPDLELGWLPHMKNVAPSAPWPVMAFLAFWLTGWTFGGLAAMGTLARLLVGVDEVRWDRDGVEVVRRVGLFSRRSTLAWSDVQQPFPQLRGFIVSDSRKGLKRLTSFGSDEERRELAGWLGEAWRESRGGDAARLEVPDGPPNGWRVETAEDGSPMLVGAVAAAAWLALGRVELRPGPGSVRRVIRFMSREWTREISSARLVLESTTDSDGDLRSQLVAIGTGGRLSLASELYSPGVTRHLGLWLGERMQVELEGLPEAAEQRRAG